MLRMSIIEVMGFFIPSSSIEVTHKMQNSDR